MVVHFDPNDKDIPKKLRDRFERWNVVLPRLQFSQYGPVDKYLNIKFPDALVKPQGLLRPIIFYIDENDQGLLPDVGNISIDSTGQTVSSKDPKTYPDFVVASYFENENKSDAIRLIMEIGSLQTREPPSERLKDEVTRQLLGYMSLLGTEGGRWADKVLGVALLGTEVWLSHPRRQETGLIFTKALGWYSLYDPKFVTEIDRIAKLCRKDAKADLLP